MQEMTQSKNQNFLLHAEKYIKKNTKKITAEEIALRLKNKLDLKNFDLSFANFKKINLSGVDFSGSDLTHAHFTKSSVTKCCFDNCKLTASCFSGATLNDVSFFNSDTRLASIPKKHISKKFDCELYHKA